MLQLQFYLSFYVNFAKVCKALPLLLRPADRSMIHCVVELHKVGPSLTFDGLAAKVYRTFEDFFAPLIEMAYKHLLGGGGKAIAIVVNGCVG